MLSEENREALEQRQMDILDELKDVAPGTDEHKALIDEQKTLGEMLIKLDQVELESDKFTYQKGMDLVATVDKKRDTAIKITSAVLGFAAPIIVCVVDVVTRTKNFKLGMGFETNGTFRSKAAMESFRQAINPKFK